MGSAADWANGLSIRSGSFQVAEVAPLKRQIFEREVRFTVVGTDRSELEEQEEEEDKHPLQSQWKNMQGVPEGQGSGPYRPRPAPQQALGSPQHSVLQSLYVVCAIHPHRRRDKEEARVVVARTTAELLRVEEEREQYRRQADSLDRDLSEVLEQCLELQQVLAQEPFPPLLQLPTLPPSESGETEKKGVDAGNGGSSDDRTRPGSTGGTGFTGGVMEGARVASLVSQSSAKAAPLALLVASGVDREAVAQAKEHSGADAAPVAATGVASEGEDDPPASITDGEAEDDSSLSSSLQSPASSATTNSLPPSAHRDNNPKSSGNQFAAAEGTGAGLARARSGSAGTSSLIAVNGSGWLESPEEGPPEAQWGGEPAGCGITGAGDPGGIASYSEGVGEGKARRPGVGIGTSDSDSEETAREELAAWLIGLGVRRGAAVGYAASLVEDGFDGDKALHGVTEEDLVLMGVKKGHARLIVRALLDSDVTV
ncbi:unnamed protein product [Discosporangium mesarthrocarpum]